MLERARNIQHMNRAGQLALRARPFPMPRVGVILAQGQRVIAESYKKDTVEPHVEVKVLLKALKIWAHEQGDRSLVSQANEIRRLRVKTASNREFHTKIQPAKEELLGMLAYMDGKGGNLRQTTLFSTLEPCNSLRRNRGRIIRGRYTGCSELIVAAGIPKVVVGILDSANPKINGNGVKQLQEGGVNVEMSDEAISSMLRAGNRLYFDMHWLYSRT